jgi:drug/metabolite transporter (DMT)-like permease
MRPAAIALALLAAVLHATWNATLRSGNDRLWSITVMSFSTTAAAIVLTLILPGPQVNSWPYLGISAVLQVGYSVFLAYAYQSGELGLVYPVVRGSVPLLVTVGSFLFAGQRLSATALVGVGLISLGIVSLSFGRIRAEAKPLALALITAVFVASYVTADGIGVRLAGDPLSYAAWIFLVYGFLLPAAFLLLRRRINVRPLAPETLKAMAGGILSLTSYAAIVAAFSVAEVGPVTALRETSIVFSLVIGRIVLGEAMTRSRIAACFVVTLGAVCISYPQSLP